MPILYSLPNFWIMIWPTPFQNQSHLTHPFSVKLELEYAVEMEQRSLEVAPLFLQLP